MHFPKDFLFGVATAAPQVEGGGFADGRGESIWDRFAQTQGNIIGGAKPSTGGCDSYHRFDEDVRNMVALGVNSYRMSIAWGRVLPEGVGSLNPKGVDYYKRCFESLLQAGIRPNVTLYHWDLPQKLEDRHGWLNRDSRQWFAEYADKMFRLFGDLVPMWVTLNEPIATYVGYAKGIFAPGYTSRAMGNQARHNVMTAHGAAVEAFRQSGAKGQIGVVIDIWKRMPAMDTPEALALAMDEDEENWKFYCDRLLGKGYSPYILEKLAREGTLMEMLDEDFRLTALPIDFYGMNYYNTLTVAPEGAAAVDAAGGGNFNKAAAMNPEGIKPVLDLIRSLYSLEIPVYITENGCVNNGPETPEADGMIHDDARIGYLARALGAVDEMLSEGADIRGYYLWTLMDNFEWCAGHSAKYGLLHTNFETFKRTWKKSAYWYRDFILRARATGRQLIPAVPHALFCVSNSLYAACSEAVWYAAGARKRGFRRAMFVLLPENTIESAAIFFMIDKRFEPQNECLPGQSAIVAVARSAI